MQLTITLHYVDEQGMKCSITIMITQVVLEIAPAYYLAVTMVL